MQVNWTMNERGHDEEAQSDYSIYIFGKNTSTNWNTIDVSQGSTRRTSLWLGMWNLNALQWRWSIEKSWPYLEPEPPRSFDALAALDLCTPSFALCLGNVTACRSLYGVGSVPLIRLHVTSHNGTRWQWGSKLCECFGARGLRMDAFVLSALHITLDLSFWICLLHSEQWYQAFFGPSA